MMYQPETCVQVGTKRHVKKDLIMGPILIPDLVADVYRRGYFVEAGPGSRT